ncbi:MAG: hypothetical protein ACFE9L_09320 [Candidatus Hodarchaeota archaeon]
MSNNESVLQVMKENPVLRKKWLKLKKEMLRMNEIVVEAAEEKEKQEG